MGTRIMDFADGAYLEYDQGSFDSWCVYIVTARGNRNAPSDTDYFGVLQEMSALYGAEKVYRDFVSLYERTGKAVDQKTIDCIRQLAAGYEAGRLNMEKALGMLYMAMIAEENKAYTKLGKRIKRLGVYKLLIEGADMETAANFMKGMNWRQIDALCRQRGF